MWGEVGKMLPQAIMALLDAENHNESSIGEGGGALVLRYAMQTPFGRCL